MGISANKKFTQSELREIFDVCSRKDLTGDWNKIRDILNTRLKKDYNESTYRKKYQSYCDMKLACKDIDPDFTGDTTEVDVQKRELERAKIQFRDERNAWQRQNYADARIEQKLDYLEQVIKETGRRKFNPNYSYPVSVTNETMVVCLSDLHIGAEYNSMWGKYNSDIAERRLAEYCSEVKSIGKRHNVNNVVVLGIGDLISGSIHKSIQVTNRETVIEQIILASEYISEFIGELCKNFSVRFVNVSGNHSRIDKKDDALKDERLDKLIGWYVDKSLSHLDNFEYIENKDTSLGEVDVCGQKYWVVHGDYDPFNKQGLANLVLAMGYKPSGVFCGHMHSAAMDDISDIKFIRSGSFGGSGDDYTIEKRLTGKPSQTVAICNHEGIECIYPVTLH